MPPAVGRISSFTGQPCSSMSANARLAGRPAHWWGGQLQGSRKLSSRVKGSSLPALRTEGRVTYWKSAAAAAMVEAARSARVTGPRAQGGMPVRTAGSCSCSCTFGHSLGHGSLAPHVLLCHGDAVRPHGLLTAGSSTRSGVAHGGACRLAWRRQGAVQQQQATQPQPPPAEQQQPAAAGATEPALAACCKPARAALLGSLLPGATHLMRACACTTFWRGLCSFTTRCTSVQVTVRVPCTTTK